LESTGLRVSITIHSTEWPSQTVITSLPLTKGIFTTRPMESIGLQEAITMPITKCIATAGYVETTIIFLSINLDMAVAASHHIASGIVATRYVEINRTAGHYHYHAYTNSHNWACGIN
jgi:hypothetical protein